MSANKTIVWTIAGSDSGGGAGIQADLKTFQDLGVHGCSVITAVTAQNSVAITHIEPVSGESITAQLHALSDDLPAGALKLGVQSDISVVKAFLSNYFGKVVFDPVISATSGATLTDNLSGLTQLLPYADIVTPNLSEAEKLTGMSIRCYADMSQAAEKLRQMGAKAVLLKGGHYEGGAFKQDYYSDAKRHFWLAASAIERAHTHGSGCTLAAAITAALALGYELPDAVVVAKMYVHQGIRLALALGKGQGPVVQAGFPDQQQDLPFLSDEPIEQCPPAFAKLRAPLGLYPVVDSSEWVLRLAKLGVKTLQLRIKSGDLESEVKSAVRIASQYDLQLFINDHWELALQYGAYGVHLGQEDLSRAHLSRIRDAGLRLGLSTHCFYEVARAHALNPSYIACGPIYATTSKAMAFAPQGLEKLAYWCRLMDYPLVAIGGINLSRAKAVMQTGVDGMALISAITQAGDVAATVAAFQAYEN